MAMPGCTESMQAMCAWVVRHDEVLLRLSWCSPILLEKLRRTSRSLHMCLWCTAERQSELTRRLTEEMSLARADVHLLCERGEAECIWLLISQGMSVKHRDRESYTLLQKATHSGSTGLLRLLVEGGANLNAKGAFGYTALHEASYVGNPIVVSLLLSMQANVDAISKNGSTPLLIAAREGHHVLVEALLRYNADADDGGDKGWTPLSMSAGEGHLEVCHTLLTYKAAASGFAGDGRGERSALHEAAEHGHAAVARLLLDSRADPHHVLDDGVTACGLAERSGHPQVASLLASYEVRS